MRIFNYDCGPYDNAYVSVDGIIASHHYLNMLNTQACTVLGDGGKKICVAGTAVVIGHCVIGQPESSYCGHVGLVVLWLIDSCTRPQQNRVDKFFELFRRLYADFLRRFPVTMGNWHLLRDVQ